MTNKYNGLEVDLDLTQLDGNAFSILAAFRKAALRQGKDKAQVDAVLEKAMSGDYDHLLQVIISNTI